MAELNPEVKQPNLEEVNFMKDEAQTEAQTEHAQNEVQTSENAQEVALSAIQVNDTQHDNVPVPNADLVQQHGEDKQPQLQPCMETKEDEMPLNELRRDQTQDSEKVEVTQKHDELLKTEAEVEAETKSEAQVDYKCSADIKVEPPGSACTDPVKETGYQCPVTSGEKNSESDANSEYLNSNNDEQNNFSSSHSSSSQFYENTETKMDFAAKIEESDTLSGFDDIKTDTDSADSEDSALGSLPPDNSDNIDNAVVHDEIKGNQERQDPAEGSDAGIGSDASDETKPSFTLSSPGSSKEGVIFEKICVQEVIECKPTFETDCISDNELNVCENKNDDSKEETDEDDDTPLAQLKRPLKSSLKRKCDDGNQDEPQAKKKKEGIRFDNVTIYYFPRAQGFSCVPSQGGSTLGMEYEHTHIQSLTIAEHALEQRRVHRQLLQQLKSENNSLDGIAISSSDDSDSDEEGSDISESELDLDSYYFLQPVPTRQRRVLLRSAGVRKIETYEKNECKDIRTSREFCGCACKGVCNPESCSCSVNGIKCQVDRLNFPCGCTRDGCGNTSGRIEFNPVRVRTHFIHTLMRLVEERNAENQALAKRQWSTRNQVSCAQSSDYARCHTQEDGLLRDVNLTPRVEVESCVNNGSFNNIHSLNNIPSIQNNMQSNMNYHYSSETVNQLAVRNDTHVMHYDDVNNLQVLSTSTAVYTSNMLQGKGPPYPNNAIAYDTGSHMQRFPCDLNYTYDQHTDNRFKGVQSYSATSFEEFAHNSQMSMFSHYSHMYGPDYLHKPSTSMHNHASLQYQAMPHTQNSYEIYKNTAEFVNSDSKVQTQSNYATLMTMPYHEKLQIAENDQNWYSRNQDALMANEASDQTTQDADQTFPEQPILSTATSVENNATETTENFGELIKNTMVESVTV